MNERLFAWADRLTELGGLLDTVIVPLLLLELAWLGYRRHLGWNRIKEMVANGVTVVVAIPTGIVAIALWDAVFGAVEDISPWAIPTTWVTAVIAVVVADFIFYWQHRYEHERRLLWDLYHSVHHSSPNFDATTSLRVGMFDVLVTAGVTVPMVAIGFPPLLAVAAMVVSLGYQTWIHTELIGRMPRWFESVFNTPSHHRVHHGTEEHYLDTNYGGILIIWDRLFGTFQLETVRPTYGLTTQIESSGPIDIQFAELRRLTQDLRGDDSWRTRFRRLWNGPAWDPLAGATATPATETTRST